MVWIHEHRFIERFSADNMHNVVPLQSFQPENNLAQRHKVFKLKTKLNFRSFCLLMAYNTPGHISHGASCRLAHASELEKAMNDTEIALASTFHILFLESLIQGLALIAQWVEFGSNDVREWQTGEVLTPERTGFRMQWIGSRHIHLVA